MISKPKIRQDHARTGRMVLLGTWLLTIPLTAVALDPEEIRHLLDRTGFGAEPRDVLVFASLDRAAAVDRVLNAPAATPQPPRWAYQRALPDHRYRKSLPEEQRQEVQRAYNRQRREQELALKAWWYQWMLDTETPLIERMTLFWHNHFTSEYRKVRSPQLMLRQNRMFRQHSLDNYGDLLRSVTTDPAMLIYLDGRSNHKAKPNENLARELLELFTLGEGHYTEGDVRNAARALTGWTLNPVSGTARFNPRRHDDGKKTLFGKTGHWGLDGVIAILLKQPRTARYLAEKLWREFISPNPDPAEVERTAESFRTSGYEIRTMLRDLLLSDAFWAEQNRGTLIKSPVELIVSTLRRLDLPLPPDRRLVRLGREMGQDIFQPPDVKGWRGQTSWIDSDRLLARQSFLQRVKGDLVAANAADGGAIFDFAQEPAATLLSPLPDYSTVDELKKVTSKQDEMRGTLIQAIFCPAYQLK